MLKNSGLLKAIILVFLASACTMVIELVAGRILAPYIGVSLYTWTSIIGVVLAGISLGNFLGGKFGDKYTSPRLLSAIFFAGAILSLVILPMTLVLKASPVPTSFHIMIRVIIYTFVLFFLPTTVLGMVTPIVIKLTLKDLGKTANVVGTIYAISTVGSILGTFLTGFFLISWFGTRTIIWEVSITLFLLALFSGGFWKSKASLSLMLVGLIAFPTVYHFRDSFQITSLRESNYFTITIYDTSLQGRPVKALALDHLIHSYVDLKDPLFQGYDYEQTFASVAKYIARDKTAMNCLMIGGGGYSFPRYIELTYPKASVEVLEIDPAVTETAHEYLGLPQDTRVITHNRDARIFLIDRPPGIKYDLVIGDAFNDASVPYHLTTAEFDASIKNVMETNGFYAVNLIDNLRDGRFVRSFMKSLGQSFKQVYIYQSGAGGVPGGFSTYVVIATNGNFSPSAFLAQVSADTGISSLSTLDEIEKALGRNDSVVLTDDYVPVDNMIAPLFATAR